MQVKRELGYDHQVAAQIADVREYFSGDQATFAVAQRGRGRSRLG